MDTVKVAKDYFVSRQSTLLIPNRDFGQRKFLHVASKPLTVKQVANLDQRKQNMQGVNKKWIHPPETLLRGHILYNVKFLGETEVEQAKGTDIIKEAVRKRKFNKHLKRAEGQKTPKVELTISADGVAVQEPKTKNILHQYPLHRISYCADDKTDKRIFTFIAKAADSNKHFCFVFDSEKCAEEITLTIGQAFDLAYRQFLETGKDSDIKKQYLLLQKKLQNVQDENKALRKRIGDLEELKDRDDIEEYKRIHQIKDVGEVEVASPDLGMDQLHAPTLILASVSLDESSTDDISTATSQDTNLLVSPVDTEPQPRAAVGRHLEGLIFEDMSHTNGAVNGQTCDTPVLSPPPASGRIRSYVHTNSNTQHLSNYSDAQHHVTANVGVAVAGQVVNQPANVGVAVAGQVVNQPVFDPFGTTSVGSGSDDPFGMGTFNPASATVDKAMQNMNKGDTDLMGGFSQGLPLSDQFSLDDLDPLNTK